ncbi:C-type lectin domain family 14 member A [Rhincodon typus]|uniref:C-type lectin domain family 14 member A n=1 Tax=Rhincodon typus TaxID=259920 RepID=UPI0009A301A6|nr:C-type lectin domain family 14 member A [Rhincodon typus]
MLRSVFILLWLQNYLQNAGVRSQETTSTFCDAGTCYSLHLDVRSFSDAEKLCEDRRGMLSTMESQSEAENIQRLLAAHVPLKAQRYHLWIGLRREVKQCYYPDKPLRGFYWVNGKDHSTYSPWIVEPQRTCTHERCVQLQVHFTNRIQLQWKSSACSKRNDGFLCKYQMCERLNVEFGEVVYQKPRQNGTEIFSAVPLGSVAIISCPNGKSVVLQCDRENGKIKWSSSQNLAFMCNNCWNKTNEGSCQNRCFQIAEDYFCYCNKDFSIDPVQRKCVPNGNLEIAFNESSRNGFKGIESVAANISFLGSTLATEAPTSPFRQPAENSTVTFPPTFRGAEQERQEAHSNSPFLIYQIVIGLLVMLLLIGIVIIIIRERERGGTQKTAPSEDGMALKNTDSAPRVNNKAAEETVIVTNANHFVETPSASENEVNVPKENGEISESSAH